MSGPSHSGGTQSTPKMLYVRSILRLLPFSLTLFRHFSKKIRAEIDYLEPGCTFMVSVEGTDLACVCQRTEKGSFKRVPTSALAKDVEPGSGLSSADTSATTVDYVIAFRSLNYAFACFSGGMSLKAALAERAFSTRGPNNVGVSLTYLFSALLGMIFGWRAALRARPAAPVCTGTPAIFASVAAHTGVSAHASAPAQASTPTHISTQKGA